MAAPVAIPYALLIAGGLAFAVPLCVVTANPAVGAALLRAGIGRLPEEIAPSPLDALALPALGMMKERKMGDECLWHSASSPSPLWGGVGVGVANGAPPVPHLPTSTPTLPTRGREKKGAP